MVTNTSDSDDLGNGYFGPKYSPSELKDLYTLSDEKVGLLFPDNLKVQRLVDILLENWPSPSGIIIHKTIKK